MNLTKWCGIFCIVVVLLACIGCASNKGAEGTSVAANIPPDSLFSKIKLRMGKKQVHDLIGQPSDFVIGTTGKQWIPFYFGRDFTRLIEYYKGEGRLVFASNGLLIKIDYDPTEDGYR